jgi:transposase
MSLSIDLRKRLVDAYENKEGSIRELAKRFKIGTTTLVTWLKKKRTEGTLIAKKPTGRPSKFDAQGLAFISKNLEQNNSLTLNELAQRYEKKRGIAVSLMAVHRACKRLKLNYKKNSLPSRTKQSRG